MSFIKFQKTEEDLNNLLNNATWGVGQTSASGFNRNGLAEENLLVNGIDPFGNESILWETRPSGNSNGDGGWNTTSFSIDKTKMYRSSVWVKRITTVSSGNFYHGIGWSTVANNSNGVTNTNPYWDCPSISSLPYDEWILIVGHIFPYDTTETGKHPDSGRWDKKGTKYATGCNIGSGDVKWVNSATTSAQRVYHFYSSTPSAQLQFAYPRIDLIDGTEPKITDLLLGYGGTTDVDNATKNGNFFLGTNMNIEYGPTRKTGFYAGIASVEGGYTIYKYSGGLYPKIYNPKDDQELVDYLKRINVGFTGSNVNDALSFAENNDNLFIVQF